MTDDPLSGNRLHDLLTARRRRYLLYCLYMYANPMRLPDVAGQVAEWEHGRPEAELMDERLEIYMSLYHTHVPKLADSDVVTYSQSEDMVELARNATRLRPQLEQAAETDLSDADISTL